jgi:transcriptional regulator with XRE-family HTH domain
MPEDSDERDGGGDDDLAGVLEAVGPRLRALRAERDITLAQVSEATGISVSTLSRLEAGRRKPTLELLLPLARAYGTQLDELVGAPETGDPRVHLRPFTRAGRTFVPLTRNLDGLQAYKVVLPPPGSDTHADSGDGHVDQRVHEGYEWLYVLSGRLRLVIGDHDLDLGEGEFAEFDTRVPHAFMSAGPGPAEVLSLFGPQGERMHVRARPRPSPVPAPAPAPGPGPGRGDGG